MGGFPKLVLQSVDEGLAKVMGEDTAKAVKFYVDPSIAAKDPDRFITSIRKMFGKGTQTIEMRILDSLYSKVGLKLTNLEDSDFAQYVEEAKRQYVHRILAEEEPPKF